MTKFEVVDIDQITPLQAACLKEAVAECKASTDWSASVIEIIDAWTGELRAILYPDDWAAA